MADVPQNLLHNWNPPMVTLDSVYENEVNRLREEVAFLREMLRLVLASNEKKGPQ